MGEFYNMEILRCSNVEKVFGKGENQVTALNGINLSIETGEFEIGRASCRERV